MQPIGSRRYFLVLACALSLGAAGAHADVSAQPNPPSATPASPPVALPLSAFMPAAIQGVVTPEEFGRYLSFLSDARSNPEIKDLNTQMAEHMRAMQEIQAKIEIARKKILDSDPAMKVIGDKIQAAIIRAQAAPARTQPASAAGAQAVVPSPAR